MQLLTGAAGAVLASLAALSVIALAVRLCAGDVAAHALASASAAGGA